MALGRNRRRERGADYWPGFVDALSTLLIAIMFAMPGGVMGLLRKIRERLTRQPG